MRGRKKVHLDVYLSPEVHQALLAQKDRTGKSLSGIIGEAIERHLFTSELQSEIRKTGEVMRAVAELLDGLRMELSAFREVEKRTALELEEITKWTKVSAFWTALLVEFFKLRFLQTQFGLSEEAFRRFKALWTQVHEIADTRIESLTGERVWRKRFDPEKVPGKN